MVTVSIILLTFNRKNLVKKAIDGILAQTYKDFELIIVDNCSKDGTEKLISSYKDKRIRYFRNDNKGIIATNMNHGSKRAKGQYIALCDDDDIWLPTKLEKQLAIMANENVALVCTNWIQFFNSSKKEITGVLKKRKSPYLTQKNILMRNIISQSTALFKKNLLDNLGYFDESLDYLSAEEFEFWLRLLKDHKAYFIQEPLVRELTHPNVFRTKGLKHLRICKKIIDDLHGKKYIGNYNYSLYLFKHNFFYLANFTGLNNLYHKINKLFNNERLE